MKLLFENWREYLKEYSFPEEEQSPINWVAPDWDYEQWELFGRGIQYLSEGEFQGILDPNIELNNVPREVQEKYNTLNEYKEFREYAALQSDSANYVAGESLYQTIKFGKLINMSLEQLAQWLIKVEDLPFKALYDLSSSNLSREEKVQKAVELVSTGNVGGETRETEKIAIDLWKSNPSMPAPMIYKKRNGEFSLLGGRTRLSACFALGINPQIWFATGDKLNDFVKQYIQEWQ
jgi:hypothetical protein